MGKSLSNKYGQKLDSAKKSATDAIKRASKRAIQKTDKVFRKKLIIIIIIIMKM